MGATDWDGKERRDRNTSDVLILEKLSTIQKDVQIQGIQIGEVHKAIYIGNGKPCIMERLTSLETSKKIIYTILGAVGLQTLAFLFMIIKEYITINNR